MKTIASIIALSALAACAQSPGSIAPVSMGKAYVAYDCRAAVSDLAQERETLAALEAQQRGAVAGDAIGVFLLGLPMSSLTGGDKAGDIGASKGKVAALEARASNCR